MVHHVLYEQLLVQQQIVRQPSNLGLDKLGPEERCRNEASDDDWWWCSEQRLQRRLGLGLQGPRRVWHLLVEGVLVPAGKENHSSMMDCKSSNPFLGRKNKIEMIFSLKNCNISILRKKLI